jgi:hypothetical protein
LTLPDKEIPLKIIDTAIFATNHQIYAEALDALFMHNTVHVAPTFTLAQRWETPGGNQGSAKWKGWNSGTMLGFDAISTRALVQPKHVSVPLSADMVQVLVRTLKQRRLHGTGDLQTLHVFQHRRDLNCVLSKFTEFTTCIGALELVRVK